MDYSTILAEAFRGIPKEYAENVRVERYYSKYAFSVSYSAGGVGHSCHFAFFPGGITEVRGKVTKELFNAVEDIVRCILNNTHTQ